MCCSGHDLAMASAMPQPWLRPWPGQSLLFSAFKAMFVFSARPWQTMPSAVNGRDARRCARLMHCHTDDGIRISSLVDLHAPLNLDQYTQSCAHLRKQLILHIVCCVLFDCPKRSYAVATWPRGHHAALTSLAASWVACQILSCAVQLQCER